MYFGLPDGELCISEFGHHVAIASIELSMFGVRCIMAIRSFGP